MLPFSFPSFDHILVDGDNNTPSRALQRWEHLKLHIDHANEQIESWTKRKDKLVEEQKKYKEEAREIFKELME